MSDHPLASLDYNERSALLAILANHQAVMASRDDLAVSYTPTMTLNNMLIDTVMFDITEAVLDHLIVLDDFSQNALRGFVTMLAVSLSHDEPAWLDESGCDCDEEDWSQN